MFVKPVYSNPRLATSRHGNHSGQMYPLVSKFARAYKAGEYDKAKSYRMKFEKRFGKGLMPFAPTKQELEDPRYLAKVASCVKHVTRSHTVRNPWAVCRASVEQYGRRTSSPRLRYRENAQTEVENYRGWEILRDTDRRRLVGYPPEDFLAYPPIPEFVESKTLAEIIAAINVAMGEAESQGYDVGPISPIENPVRWIPGGLR